MNKKQRQPYLDIVRLAPGHGLCNCCMYCEVFGGSYCDGVLECCHPLDVINDSDHFTCVWGEGADCWAFRPNSSLSELATWVGIVLDGNIAQWIDGKWVAVVYNKEEKKNVD